MSTTLPTRPATNGTTRSSSTNGQNPRQGSLSSFPSRTPSNQSLQNGAPPKIPAKSRARSNSIRTTSSPASPAKRDSAPQTRTQRVRKLKPQYPLDSSERHVEYILVASFDIDKGPTMEHQYPGAISGDENMLAELMLPDQTHTRAEDWTIFFLHKDNTEEEEAREQRRREREERREEIKRAKEAGEPVPEYEDSLLEDEDDEAGEGPPLIYVLNLVNTKQDTTAKRGAVVKAMAICTRHSFLHIYKPLLLLALQEYFRQPKWETLELLYDAVNSMDLSLMPRLTILERHILQSTDVKDMFREKFEQMIQQRMLEESAHSVPLPDSPTKQTFNLDRHGIGNRELKDTHEYQTRVIYRSHHIPIKVPTAISPEIVGDFSLIKLIQIFSAPHTATPQPFMLHPHLTTNGAYTHPILVLVNALLTQKRVIFLGHNRPSGEVAEAVLAACALVSGGVLRGFTRHAFPYTDLTKIDDLLNVPGFIAGVTNPAFANHPEWWDLLCDIPSGRMKISNRIEQALTTDGLLYFQQQHPAFAPSNTGVLPGPGTSSSNPLIADPNGDGAFMNDILQSIGARHGEAALRSKWRDYISKFTRLAAAFEEGVYGASALYIGASEADAGVAGISGHGYVWPDETARARELGANVWRIEGWRNTRSYYALINDLAGLWGRKPIKSMDMTHQLDRLRTLKLSHEDSAKIFLALREMVVSYDEICQLLTATPENHAGLFYLSLGIFHPDQNVREATVDILSKIKDHEAGKHYWAALGKFAKVAFYRVQRDMINRAEQIENDDGRGRENDRPLWRARTAERA